MPVSYRMDPATGFIHTRCVGHVTLDEVLDHFGQLENDERLPERLNVLLDETELTSVPDSDGVRTASQAIAALKERVHWGACALVVDSEVHFGMARVFEAMVEGLFDRTWVFRDRDEALRWLEGS